jgi:thymidylate synthase
MTDLGFSAVWLNLISDVYRLGEEVSPRGMPTKELHQHTIVVDMMRPVLTIKQRALNYRFMAAEAYWILTGDDRVEEVSRYNKHMSNFSDDGVRLYGAYGPPFRDQLNYVIHTLISDNDSRRAGLTLWRQNPEPSKDIPCTVSLFWGIRQGAVNAHVFMRSNDVWLGTPYDVFSFSMMSYLVCAWFNELNPLPWALKPGKLYLTAASSHLYQTMSKGVEELLAGGSLATYSNESPEELWKSTQKLLTTLQELRETKPGHPLRWWEVKP